ncbi:MAG: carboxymuconolactone decarboxylase family protein [bacterium]
MNAKEPGVSYPDKLQHIKANLKTLTKAQPATLAAFSQLHHTATTQGVLDTKTKELIALSIAVALRCDGCITFHAHDALSAGASEAEINEALGVAILMGGGPSVVYATHVVEAVAQFKTEKEVDNRASRGNTAEAAHASAYVGSDYHFD